MKKFLLIFLLSANVVSANEGKVVLGSAKISFEYGDAAPSVSELMRRADASAIAQCASSSEVQRISEYDVRRGLIPYFGTSLLVSAFYQCK